jgi:tRNA modification GTPase
MHTHDTRPIAAIATAVGRGGIGVIRISGANLAEFSQRFFTLALTPRHAHYLPFLDDDGSLIDQGIVIFFPGPHSYTGEDVLELHGHGGPAVLHNLLSRCLRIGQPFDLRLAQPGEFSLRAFLNGKIDLTQAEAIADLIDASSSAAAKAAAASLSGRFSNEIQTLTSLVVNIRTLVEATLDFPEEELEFIEKYQVKHHLALIRKQLADVIEISRKSVYLKDGLKVVLAGEPNVGKSSLMNALFEQDIAIVTDIPGTTRDRINQTLHLDGIPISVTDTAGLRQTTDIIEQLGIERSWVAIKDADLVLHVIDASKDELSHEIVHELQIQTIPTLSVINKVDLIGAKDINKFNLPNQIKVSARTGFGLDKLKEYILGVSGRQSGDVSPWLGRQRHVQALEIAMHHIERAEQHATFDDRVLDLLAEELRLAHDALGTITGQMSADDLLGEIFSNFCIGK